MAFDLSRPAVWYNGAYYGHPIVVGLVLGEVNSFLKPYGKSNLIVDSAQLSLKLAYNGCAVISVTSSSFGESHRGESSLVALSGSINQGSPFVNDFDCLLRSLEAICKNRGLVGESLKVQNAA